MFWVRIVIDRQSFGLQGFDLKGFGLGYQEEK